MKKIFLLIVAPFAFFSALSAQVSQEEADRIVLERMSQETQSYTVYAKENVRTEMIITTVNEEMLELDYPCWVYYISYVGKVSIGHYLIVNESNGNLLEIKSKEDACPSDLAEWREVYNFPYFDGYITLKFDETLAIPNSNNTTKVSFKKVKEGRCLKSSCEFCDFLRAEIQLSVINNEQTVDIDLAIYGCLGKSANRVEVSGYRFSLEELLPYPERWYEDDNGEGRLIYYDDNGEEIILAHYYNNGELIMNEEVYIVKIKITKL